MSMRVVSLFSGGGGLDLGFLQEGYNIIWAIDNQKDAVSTYRHNLGKHIICADINDLAVNNIPDCDLMIGGPPCQSFSLSGNRNVEDARGQLVWKYMEILKAKQPGAFLFENVTGLLSAKNSRGEKIIELLFEAFREIGYTIVWKTMNSADYGVPQKRRRVIIVGLKGDRHFEFPLATHGPAACAGLKPYVTVKEALGDLPPIDENTPGNGTFVLDAPPSNDFLCQVRSPDNRVTEHEFPTMSDLDKYIVQFVRPGGNYMDIPADVPSKRIQRLQRDGGHTTCYGRMAPDEPSYTINTYFNRPNVGCNIHYSQNRLITVREALRLQSFPDSYELVSSSKQGRHKIVGNAVPPMLARAFAKQLKGYLLCKGGDAYVFMDGLFKG